MSRIPSYRAIYDDISARIAGGEYGLGATLPREFDLAATFGVSRNTVRSALAMLEADGMIRRVRNAGTTVVATTRSLKIDFNFSSTAGIRNMMRSTRFVLLNRARRDLPDSAPSPVGWPDRTGWIFLRGMRVDRVGGQPVGLNEIYVRPDLEAVLADVDITQELIWPRFSALFGMPIATMRISLKPIVLTRAEAELLATRRGQPAMQLLEVLRTESGDVVEVISSTYLASNFDFAVEVGVRTGTPSPDDGVVAKSR
jgi:DNA-binding GntR family transcriptional regulator